MQKKKGGGRVSGTDLDATWALYTHTSYLSAADGLIAARKVAVEGKIVHLKHI